MRRLPIRKIREALRLKSHGLAGRKIAESLGIGRTTLRDYLHRAELTDLSWPLPADLESRLYSRPSQPQQAGHPQPDFAKIHNELR